MLGITILSLFYTLTAKSSIPCFIYLAIQQGFCGCLTTTSGVVYEILTQVQSLKWKYIYGIGSMLAGQLLLILIIGIPFWISDGMNIYC